MVVDGIKTNVPLQQRIMADIGFQQGGTNIHYLEKRLAERKEKGDRAGLINTLPPLRSPPVRKFLVMMSLCACVSGLAQGREVIFWGKSMEARKGQERACFYATVSVPSDVQKSNMLLTISFKKVPAEKKNDVAEFPWIARVSRGNDFNLGTESGDVMEACVKPGRYAISELKLSTGTPGVGAYYAMFDRGLGPQPVSLEFQAGKDYYLRQLPGLPRRSAAHHDP